MDAAYSLLSSPTIYKNLVIIGAGTGEGPGGSNGGAGPAGDTRAWDARTGKLVWTFHTVPRQGEFDNIHIAPEMQVALGSLGVLFSGLGPLGMRPKYVSARV